MSVYVLSICHCTLNHYRVKFPTPDLPLPSSFCHCNTCRHSSGQLFTSTIPILGPPLDPYSNEEREAVAGLENLVAYPTSPNTTRYFCVKCSAYMFLCRQDGSVESKFHVFTGSLEKVEGISTVRNHLFIADTLDGGVADHYRTEGKVDIGRFSRQVNSDLIPIGWKADSITASESVERLPFRCHCGTISFELARTHAIKDPKAEYWLVPSRTGPIKYVGGHDVCIDCRLSGGNQFQSWIVVSHAAIVNPQTGESIDLTAANKRLSGLKQYESSPGRFRESCGTCGASVFWWKKGASKLDIAAGLVDESVGGARAQKWVYWYDKVVHPSDAVDYNSQLLVGLPVGVKATNESQ